MLTVLIPYGMLSFLQVLTLRKGRHTTGQRSRPLPQIKCVGGDACQDVVPEVIQCRNQGYDGQDYSWKCDTELEDLYRLGETTVTCEGYDVSGQIADNGHTFCLANTYWASIRRIHMSSKDLVASNTRCIAHRNTFSNNRTVRTVLAEMSTRKQRETQASCPAFLGAGSHGLSPRYPLGFHGLSQQTIDTRIALVSGFRESPLLANDMMSPDKRLIPPTILQHRRDLLPRRARPWRASSGFLFLPCSSPGKHYSRGFSQVSACSNDWQFLPS